MNIALTISICINIFQALVFWAWSIMLILAYKQKMDEVKELKKENSL